MKTYEEKIEAAAEEFDLNQECTCDDLYSGTCWYHLDEKQKQRYGFKAGVSWANANPSDEVLALVEALEKNKSEWEAISMTPGGHKHLVAWQMANKALAAFRAAQEKK